MLGGSPETGATVSAVDAADLCAGAVPVSTLRAAAKRLWAAQHIEAVEWAVLPWRSLGGGNRHGPCRRGASSRASWGGARAALL